MPHNNGSSFEIDRLPTVDDQIRELARRAKAAGLLDEFLGSMRRIVFELRQSPLTWGDPLYHTNKAGGVVFRGITKLVVVQYVVYEEEHVVYLLRIGPVSSGW